MVPFATDAKRSTSAEEKYTMTTFARWSGVVHTTLSSLHPKFKYSHAQEILSAALGHRTYASLRTLDLAALHEHTKYVLFDDQAPLSRAARLGLPITLEQWHSAAMKLKPSGISGGRWMIHHEQMADAARIVFEDASHPVLHQVANAIGIKDGHWARAAYRVNNDVTLPEELRYLVQGEVQAFNDEVSLAMPVIA
jgi:hypothetical protein